MRVLVRSKNTNLYWGDYGCGVVSRENAFSYDHESVTKRIGTVYDDYPIHIEFEEVADGDYPHANENAKPVRLVIVRNKSDDLWWTGFNENMTKLKTHARAYDMDFINQLELYKSGEITVTYVENGKYKLADVNGTITK